MDAFSLVVLLLIPIVALLFYDFTLSLRLPPGPRPLPIIGNIHLIPKKAPWLQFQQWAQQYGPIFTLWIGRRPTIVISDPVVAADLLEKRSANYSSRPRFVTMGELYWDNASILVQPYGKDWQTRRRMLHHALNPSALRLYKSVQEAEATRLCSALLNLADNDDGGFQSWERQVDCFAASVVFSIAYGHRVDSMDANVIRRRIDFARYVGSLNVPGKYLVETLPWLKHVPNFLAPWKAEIQRRGQIEAEFNMSLVRGVQERMKKAKTEEKQSSDNGNDDIPDSLTKFLLEARDSDPDTFGLLSERDFSYIPGSLFGAGSDTTASSISSGILMLLANPAVQAIAHAELDHVLGSQQQDPSNSDHPPHSPTFPDESQLPYLKALVTEILRIRPVAVLGGTPHANTKADTYNGYYIPPQTTILSNLWAINLHDGYYPNPHHFNPLRFLSVPAESLPYLPPLSEQDLADLKADKKHPAKEGHASFGWGRRVCPGAGLAQNSMFIALTKLLWMFDMLPVEEEGKSERGQGTRRYDLFRYTEEGFNMRPKSFDCVFRVRDEWRRSVLREEMEEARGVLEKFTPFCE